MIEPKSDPIQILNHAAGYLSQRCYRVVPSKFRRITLLEYQSDRDAVSLLIALRDILAWEAHK